jgi:hypothetical protein
MSTAETRPTQDLEALEQLPEDDGTREEEETDKSTCVTTGVTDSEDDQPTDD